MPENPDYSLQDNALISILGSSGILMPMVFQGHILFINQLRGKHGLRKNMCK